MRLPRFESMVRTPLQNHDSTFTLQTNALSLITASGEAGHEPSECLMPWRRSFCIGDRGVSGMIINSERDPLSKHQFKSHSRVCRRYCASGHPVNDYSVCVCYFNHAAPPLFPPPQLFDDYVTVKLWLPCFWGSFLVAHVWFMRIIIQ